MKVWVLEHESYGDVSVWSADTNPLEIPLVKSELKALVGGYDDEIERFVSEVERAVARGSGHADIEERFCLELTEVSTL